VEAGIGMYAVGTLVILFPAIMVTFDPGDIWQRVQWANDKPPPRMSGEVVLTMIAAESFDPHLIWDSETSGPERHG
jgi:uncharacterized paraquat-inducible protein A